VQLSFHQRAGKGEITKADIDAGNSTTYFFSQSASETSFYLHAQAPTTSMDWTKEV
jgi:hypothetical protein